MVHYPEKEPMSDRSQPDQATARAHPNIAFIKYWGNKDNAFRIPANGSISMNLDGLETRTTVRFEAGLPADRIEINGTIAEGKAAGRVVERLDEVRGLAGFKHFAQVESRSNFPAGAGIASSAAAFAALALAASRAAGLELDEPALSRLARHGSGSACRSIPGGYVEWLPGEQDRDSYAVSIAPADHWRLVDCVVVLSDEHKQTGSTEGHALAGTSPLQPARLADAPRRLDLCRAAVLHRDFEALAAVVELDSDMMHAVMMTSHPALFYWQAATLEVMRSVREARAGGRPVCYTIDAGPNVHVLCPGKSAEDTAAWLRQLPGVRDVLRCDPGGPARLV
jgi:diphosphomevalonate decarboxylase